MIKVIHWELCKRLRFDQTEKWYICKPESAQENETHKIIWNFEIQTDHPNSVGRPDLVLINKKKITDHLMDFVISAYYIVKIKENGNIDKYSDLGRELKTS